MSFKSCFPSFAIPHQEAIDGGQQQLRWNQIPLKVHLIGLLHRFTRVAHLGVKRTAAQVICIWHYLILILILISLA